MAADIFETYTITIIATMILGTLIFPCNSQILYLPLFLGAVSIFASIVGSFFVKLGKKKSIMAALSTGIIVTGVLSAIGFYPLINSLNINNTHNHYLSSLLALLIVSAMFIITEYYTSTHFTPL